jgi:hypothetical protein
MVGGGGGVGCNLREWQVQECGHAAAGQFQAPEWSSLCWGIPFGWLICGCLRPGAAGSRGRGATRCRSRMGTASAPASAGILRQTVVHLNMIIQNGL